MERANAITLLRSADLIDHNLEDLVEVSIQFSPSLSPPSLPENDFASRDATYCTQIDSYLPQPTKP